MFNIERIQTLLVEPQDEELKAIYDIQVAALRMMYDTPIYHKLTDKEQEELNRTGVVMVRVQK